MAKNTENEIKDDSVKKDEDAVISDAKDMKEDVKKDKASKTRTLNPAEETEESLKISVLLTELIGTFILTGAVIKLVQQGTLGTVGIAFVLMILIVLFGSMSETYFNPAIAIGLLINRKIDLVKTIAYIIAQIIGALLALLVFHAIWKAGLNSALVSAINSQGGASTLQQYGGSVSKLAAAQNMSLEQLAKQIGLGFINMTLPNGQVWYALAVEALGSAVFGLGIGHAVYADKKPALETSFSVGFALLAGMVLAGSTAILNPALATAVGVFQWGKGLASLTFWGPILVYVLGTIIGMTIGITVYRLIREKALDVNVF